MSAGTALFENVLLVEDEQSLVTALTIALRKLGLTARHASTLKQARELIAESTPDLILLDRNLPDGDGIELCADLRAEGYPGSILLLTAIGETEARVAGLNAGADDYLPKPFAWEELEARIRALARRKPAARSPAARAEASEGATFSQWKLDDSRLQVTGPKGTIQLTPLEFKLATCLIAGKGDILTRDQLLKEVWGFTLLPKTRTVDHFMGRLRKHFEENPESPKHFLTVRGAGYRFEP
jgi:DNA-binding response OmpR family regulator